MRHLTFRSESPNTENPYLTGSSRPDTPLDEAAKCALVSMDSTLKSNLSVGLPLDMVVYEVNQFQYRQIVCIDEHNPYFQDAA
jgi:putative proteasome-type protease